ncbi:hypothetical protein OG883_04395 [Streptomyces sp. NBC_01142]|uniref:hypothetical protein n=1 Tax=Streptomyces sp. NBC_01142 TaxID=2975865 RepID=UPI0022512F0C|nr:hypothetical protein [Streptomyces sp. NBC_01142]MCX4819154.1 hypothetical protein [Streptomyces sp. NBC_01142]
MSQPEDLTAIQRRLDELVDRVGQLERTVDQLRSGPATRGERKTPGHHELVTIPDTPYNSALWTDSDDEGLGASDRHAP